jgi:hypothetical protein
VLFKAKLAGACFAGAVAVGHSIHRLRGLRFALCRPIHYKGQVLVAMGVTLVAHTAEHQGHPSQPKPPECKGVAMVAVSCTSCVTQHA